MSNIVNAGISYTDGSDDEGKDCFYITYYVVDRAFTDWNPIYSESEAEKRLDEILKKQKQILEKQNNKEE